MEPAPEISNGITINPAFARNLKSILERLYLREGQMREILNKALKDVTAIMDFLDFEIAKTEIKINAFKGNSDEQSAVDLRLWHHTLTDVRSHFPIENLPASMEYLEKLIEQLETIFVEDKQDIDEDNEG